MRATAKITQRGGGLLSFTGNVISDLLAVVMQAIRVLTRSAEVGLHTVGTTAQTLGDDILKVHATQLFRGVAMSAKQVSEGLGNVIGLVPLLGKPSAYLVEHAGTGVHYVVTKVGDALGEVSSRTGRAARDASNLVVFTVASAQASADKVAAAVNDKIRHMDSLVESTPPPSASHRRSSASPASHRRSSASSASRS